MPVNQYTKLKKALQKILKGFHYPMYYICKALLPVAARQASFMASV